MNDPVTDALQSARPTIADDWSDGDATIRDLVHRTRRDAGARRRVVFRWAALAIGIPIAGLATTGAAVTVDSTLHPDVIIPVHYVTDAGVAHDCTVYIEGGSAFAPGSSVIADALRDRDWTGVGARIYERALDLSAALAATSTMSPDARDAWAWSAAETQLTVLDLPGVELPDGEHAVSVSDCTGDLH